MANYNQWMNQKLYDLCADIPDQTRKADLGAFFQSIHGTLNHLLYVDRAWMERFTEQPFLTKNSAQILYDDFNEMRVERSMTDAQILEWSKQLTADWLAQPFQYTSNIDGKTRVLPAWILVTHLFNHQTHHRGQLTTLLSQLGYDPGVTDLPWLTQLNP